MLIAHNDRESPSRESWRLAMGTSKKSSKKNKKKPVEEEVPVQEPAPERKLEKDLEDLLCDVSAKKVCIIHSNI